MTDLVVCLSRDEKTWPHIQKLIKDAEWKNIYIVTDEYCKQRFTSEKKLEYVVVDFSKPVLEVINEIIQKLKNKFYDFEVALNLVSGSGKEHMAILSALLKTGVGIRLVAVTKDGIRDL